MGWWERKKTIVDAEPKTDTLQQTSSGDTSMATNIYPTVSIGTGGLGAVTVGGNTYSVALPYNQYVGQIVSTSPYPQYNYYTAGSGGGSGGAIGISGGAAGPLVFSSTSPVYIMPNQYGAQTMPSGFSWQQPVNEIPNRSEFTEDEIEQAERLMEELSHA